MPCDFEKLTALDEFEIIDYLGIPYDPHLNRVYAAYQGKFNCMLQNNYLLF
jgi:hypothetical protein